MSLSVSKLKTLRRDDHKAKKKRRMAAIRTKLLEIENEFQAYEGNPELRTSHGYKIDELLADYEELKIEKRNFESISSIKRILKFYFWFFVLFCSTIIFVSLYTIFLLL